MYKFDEYAILPLGASPSSFLESQGTTQDSFRTEKSGFSEQQTTIGIISSRDSKAFINSFLATILRSDYEVPTS